VSAQILKVFYRDYILGRKGSLIKKVQNLNDFSFRIVKEISIYSLKKVHVFQFIIYDTNSWGMELIQMLHSTKAKKKIVCFL
jgi:hypothetical protein